MSFRWTTTGPWLHTTCTVCELTYTGSERDLLRWQRGHDKDHDRNAQLVARQARIDAATRAQLPWEITESAPQTWDNGDISETAPSVTSTPPLTPRVDGAST